MFTGNQYWAANGFLKIADILEKSTERVLR